MPGHTHRQSTAVGRVGGWGVYKNAQNVRIARVDAPRKTRESLCDTDLYVSSHAEEENEKLGGGG